ncbi:hypothetical protein U9M48_040282 [Paspalum notatum var. saurae]|uniref:Uncharacterized protein n=1 Tax=Paspalum notatum var. saurae TaxID=547442 RepID=A0AAQ3UKP0_PASNO
MASSSPRTCRTSSVSSVETAQGTHSFKITSYSLHKKVSVDKRFCSAPFAVGGHHWRIRYYTAESQGGFNRDVPYSSVYLELIAEAGKLVAKVSAIYKFRMVKPVTGASVSRGVNWPEEFYSGHVQGFTEFVRADEVDKYVQNDSLLIECDVTVIKEVQVKETQQTAETSDFDIQVPPTDLSHDLGRLLESEEEADVAFKVQGEVFRAHKIVLAMRSPVFKAQLFGPMSDGKGMAETEVRTIEGMDPTTFRGLLHFIYTDSFPPPPFMDEDAEQDEHQDMVKHLLVAADRYGMERMKLVCECILFKSLDVGSVAYTLALAGQHHCSSLKNACIEFIVSSDGMDAVLSSQGYEHLKRACPDVAVELWEKTVNRSRVMRSSSSKSTYVVPY